MARGEERQSALQTEAFRIIFPPRPLLAPLFYPFVIFCVSSSSLFSVCPALYLCFVTSFLHFGICFFFLTSFVVFLFVMSISFVFYSLVFLLAGSVYLMFVFYLLLRPSRGLRACNLRKKLRILQCILFFSFLLSCFLAILLSCFLAFCSCFLAFLLSMLKLNFFLSLPFGFLLFFIFSISVSFFDVELLYS